MKTDKGMLWLIGYMAFSSACLGYLGTDESYKYIPAELRFWIIGWFISSNATAVAIKGFYTENKKPNESTPEEPEKPQSPTETKPNP